MEFKDPNWYEAIQILITEPGL